MEEPHPGPLSERGEGRKTTSPPPPLRRGGGGKPPPRPPLRRGEGEEDNLTPRPLSDAERGEGQPHPPAPSPTRREEEDNLTPRPPLRRGRGGNTTGSKAETGSRFEKVTALLQKNVDQKQIAGAVALVLRAAASRSTRRRSGRPTLGRASRWPTTQSSASPR